MAVDSFELRGFLAGLGVDYTEALTTGRLLLFKNTGHVARHTESDSPPHDTCFQLLVLDDHHSPQWYIKFRNTPSSPDGLREIRAYDCFAQSEESRRVTASHVYVSHPHVTVQAIAAAKGRRADSVLPSLPHSEMMDLTGRVMDAASALSDAYLEECRPPPPPGRVEAEITDILGMCLSENLLAGSDRDFILTLLPDSPLAPSAQHRDLWPENIFVDEATLTIIDFDSFAMSSVPFLDAFHWARTSTLLRTPRPGATDWLAQFISDPQVHEMTVHALERRTGARAPSLNSLVGMALYYLSDITLHTFMRGAPEAFWVPMKDELARSLLTARSL